MLNTIVFDITFWENFQMLKWIPFSNKLERLAFFIQQKANSREARIGLYFFSALESIIIPIPTDPLMAACVYAAPKRWWKIAILTASCSVLGGLIGWGIGWFFGDFISFLLKNNNWMEIIKTQLGENYKVAFSGIVESLGGSADQQWHRDGNHLYENTLIESPYALTCFIPLIEINSTNL